MPGSYICKEAGCPYSETGECLEDLEPSNCPHALWQEESDDIDESPNDDSIDPSEALSDTLKKTIPLFSGEEVSLSALNTITYRYRTNLAVILGESEAGKTTFLATLFDLLNIAPLGPFLFAGSQTQIGFEARCHLARTSSGRSEPHTQKTFATDFGFLHLALKHGDYSNDTKHLLISDVSGERIMRARNSSSEMEDLNLVKYAHRIVYFIDGERLAQPTTRNSTIHNAEQFIQRALDTGIFSKASELLIVFSKADTLHNHANFSVEQVQSRLEGKFKSQLKDIIFLSIAVRPQNHHDVFQLGFGVEPLLSYFFSFGDASVPASTSHPNISSTRYFNKYQHIPLKHE